MQGTRFPAGGMGIGAVRPLLGFGMAEIGNRKERLRVREAGASAAGRGQRPYASFPDDFDLSPLNPLRTPLPPLKTSRDTLHPETGVTSLTIALRGTSEGWDYEFADHKKCRGAHGASQKREVQKPQVSGGVWGKAPKRRRA